MYKISRHILILFLIICFAYVLPSLYWLIFDNNSRTPVIEYSSTKQEFVFLRFNTEPTRSDSDGKILTKEEYERSLPLIYANQLLRNGEMPDSVMGVETDIHAIHFNTNRHSYKPKNQHNHQIKLFPLFESESNRVQIELPNDFFRINNSIEFINAENNRVNVEKSETYTLAMQKKGFSFPARIIAGIPTTRKSKDEGYFLVDNANRLYHLKMVKNEPFFEYIQIPEGITIQHIECVDFKTREYYALVFDTNNNVYVLIQDIYSLIKLPVTNFNQNTDLLKINENMLFKKISTISNNKISIWIIDDMYNIINSYSESIPDKFQKTYGKLFKAVFPFEIKIKDKNSSNDNFTVNTSNSSLIILTNTLLCVVYILLLKIKRRKIKNNIGNIITTCLFGIFGFAAVLIIPQKDY